MRQRQSTRAPCHQLQPPANNRPDSGSPPVRSEPMVLSRSRDHLRARALAAPAHAAHLREPPVAHIDHHPLVNEHFDHRRPGRAPTATQDGRNVLPALLTVSSCTAASLEGGASPPHGCDWRADVVGKRGPPKRRVVVVLCKLDDLPQLRESPQHSPVTSRISSSSLRPGLMSISALLSYLQPRTKQPSKPSNPHGHCSIMR
jgi:hypothetical protein